jgi:hypothetical protein
MNMKKFATLAALMAGGVALQLTSCGGGFWQGFFNTGWPTNNRVVNIAIDVLKEELFG